MLYTTVDKSLPSLCNSSGGEAGHLEGETGSGPKKIRGQKCPRIPESYCFLKGWNYFFAFLAGFFAAFLTAFFAPFLVAIALSPPFGRID
jgi:hypothetical protein